MKTYITKLTIIISIIIPIFLLLSCSSDNSTSPDYSELDKENISIVDIKWDESTVVFNVNDISDLIRIDTLKQIYYFRANSSKASSLKVGDNVVINNYNFFKVDRVNIIGQEKQVFAKAVPFTEVVKDAFIKWEHTINLNIEQIMKTYKALGAKILAITSDSLGFNIKLGSFEYTVSLKLLDNILKIDLTIEKVVADTKVARLVLEGEIKRFRYKGLIKIVDHNLEDFQNSGNYLIGEFTIKISAAGSGNDLNIEVPLQLFKLPLSPIPFLFLDLKCLVVMNAVVPQGASTLLEYKFKYDSDQGFTYHKGANKASPFVNLRDYSFENLKQPQSGAPGAMALSWGLGIPRFELNLGAPEIYNTTIGWFHSAYLVGGDYTFQPPCQQSKAAFLGAYGWALGAFGLNVISGSGNLWKYEKVFLKAGDCP